MTLLYTVIGAWIGIVLTYFEWYRPMEKKIKDLEKVDKKSAAINGNVTNNMFFGTTADLQLLLKKGKVEEE